MDTIKVSLIVVITLIAYYLLMQWPPATAQTPDSGVQSLSEIEKTVQDKVVIIPSNYNDFVDSKDSLTPLKEEPLIGVDTQIGSSENLSLNEIFYFENEVIRMGVEAFTGRFVSSEMKKIKQTRGGINLCLF